MKFSIFNKDKEKELLDLRESVAELEQRQQNVENMLITEFFLKDQKLRFPDNIIWDMINETDIVGVIGKYVPLKKDGHNYIGLCPFHKEKTPSFCVNVDKKTFYCFGCGKHGDVLNFLLSINKEDGLIASIKELSEYSAISTDHLFINDSKGKAPTFDFIRDILDKLKLPYSTKAILTHCSLIKLEVELVVLSIQEKHKILLHDEHLRRIEDAFAELFGHPMEIRFE